MRKKCSVKMNDIIWTVVGVERDADELDFDGEVVFGLTVYASLTIFVRAEDVSRDVLRRTITHELVHAAIYSYGYDGSSMNEEAIANFFECFGEEIMNDSDFVYGKIRASKPAPMPATNVLWA